MDSLKQPVCRLCLNLIIDTNYELIEDDNSGIVKSLLTKLEFDDSTNNHCMCGDCSTKLHAAVEFKSICLATDNIIVSYGNCEEMLPLDLREVYQMENDNKDLSDSSSDHDVCRLCMQLVSDEFKPVEEVELGLLQQYIPELNFSLTRDPVMCLACFNSIHTNYDFMNNCLNAQIKIETVPNEQVENLGLTSVFIKSEEEIEGVKTEESEQVFVKDECMGVMSEDELEEYGDTSFDAHDGSMLQDPLEAHDIVNVNKNHKNSSQLQMHQCQSCDYKSIHKFNIKKHMLKHKDPSEIKMHRCNFCQFNTRWKNAFETHMLRHANPADLKLHKCPLCEHRTKRKSLLRDHILTHTDILDSKTYQCQYCKYRARQKSNLKRHTMLKHVDPSLVQTYQCSQCDYRSVVKSSINQHMLIHQDSSQVLMHKCEQCQYQSKSKDNLARHTIVHKDASEITTYQCESCDYRSKFKHDLKKHELKHKDLSEMKIYECPSCDYTTKWRSAMENHKMTHTDASDKKLHECQSCDFQTRWKSRLKSHEASHADSSQTHHLLDYMSKSTDYIAKHMAVRKEKKVHLHECQLCVYKSKWKYNLKKHMLKHSDASETQMYHCHWCDFTSKWKSALDRHKAKHEDPTEVRRREREGVVMFVETCTVGQGAATKVETQLDTLQV